MGNIIMILSLLAPIAHQPAMPTNQPVEVSSFKTIRRGMTATELIAAFGNPINSESVHDWSTDKDYERYYWTENIVTRAPSPCLSSLSACYVDMENGRASILKNIKPSLIKE